MERDVIKICRNTKGQCTKLYINDAECVFAQRFEYNQNAGQLPEFIIKFTDPKIIYETEETEFDDFVKRIEKVIRS